MDKTLNRVKINGEIYDTNMLSYNEKLEEIGGRDFREYVEYLENEDKEMDKKMDSDLDSYEAQLDEQSCVFYDLHYNLNQIQLYLQESKRIDRQYLKDFVEENLKMIRNII